MKVNGKNILSYLVIVALALLLAVNYYIFIIENNFAPAGLNGIATMIQYKTGFSISYVSLIINIPLCLLFFFCFEKEYAVKSLVFTLVYSFAYLYLQKSGLDKLQYDAGGHDTIFPVIISGVLSGVVAGFSLKNNSSSGGMELVSKIINAKRPNTNFFMVAFTLNAIVAVVSLFVYSNNGTLDYKPVALCITYCFVSNYVGNYIIKGTKTAYQFTVITEYPDEIAEELTRVLRHGATKITAEGAYTKKNKTVLLCVVNNTQVADFRKIISKYENTFSYCETVNETFGNFKKIKNSDVFNKK